MNRDYVVAVAKEQFSRIEKYIRDNYIHFYSLYSKPGEKFETKEEIVRNIHNEVNSTLMFICHENDFGEDEPAILSASPDFADEYRLDLLEQWIKEYEKSGKKEFPLIGSMRLMLEVDDRFGFNGDNSKGFLHALMMLFQLIIDAVEDEDIRSSRVRIALGIITNILETAEAKRFIISSQRPVVKTKKQVFDNIVRLDNYLSNMDNELDRQFALERIKLGTCFIAVKVQNGYRFYPSRFVGYIDNSRADHEFDYFKDGMETNRAIQKILEKKPVFSQDLEDEYYKYCSWLGIQASSNGAWGVQRKYWTMWN